MTADDEACIAASMGEINELVNPHVSELGSFEDGLLNLLGLEHGGPAGVYYFRGRPYEADQSPMEDPIAGLYFLRRCRMCLKLLTEKIARTGPNANICMSCITDKRIKSAERATVRSADNNQKWNVKRRQARVAQRRSDLMAQMQRLAHEVER